MLSISLSPHSLAIPFLSSGSKLLLLLLFFFFKEYYFLYLLREGERGGGERERIPVYINAGVSRGEKRPLNLLELQLKA